MSDWISVKDRLPERRGEYIVMIDGAFCATTLIFFEDCWFEKGYEESPYRVTHWMPLPEPPKEERHAE